jgi:hypothetical protein
MAAAMPYCDVFMPAHSLTGLRALFEALGSGSTVGKHPIYPERRQDTFRR